MANYGPEPLGYTLVAGEDLSTHQFAPLAFGSDGKVVRAQDPSAVFFGVLGGDSKPRAGEHASVVCGPAITKGRMGLAVTAGNYLTVGSGGWFIPGQKATFNTSVWANAGSKTAIVGIAMATVASGAVGTMRLYEKASTINSN